jgi:ATP-dependent Clp protease ATP-binding subunit ClpC
MDIMFERFTEKTVKAIMLAQEESRRLGHNFVGTEQLLLGLIAEGTGIAAKALISLGITLTDARLEVEKMLGKRSNIIGVEVPFTPRSKRVLELALQESQKLGHNCIDTEHLLLSLLRDGEGLAPKILANLGFSREEIWARVMTMISEQPFVLAGSSLSRKKTSTLNECGTDLTQLATAGKLDPVIGRQTEVERMIQILSRRTNLILQGLRSRYEQHHRLRISDLALEAAVKLSDRYISDRFLPDKAIDLIDEAGSRGRILYSKRLCCIITPYFAQKPYYAGFSQ